MGGLATYNQQPNPGYSNQMAPQTGYTGQPLQYQGGPSQQVSFSTQVKPRMLTASRHRPNRSLRHKDITQTQARFHSKPAIPGPEMVSPQCLCRRKPIVLDDE